MLDPVQILSRGFNMIPEIRIGFPVPTPPRPILALSVASDSGRNSSAGKEERSNTGPSTGTSAGGLHRMSASSTQEYSGGRRLMPSSAFVSLSDRAEQLNQAEGPLAAPDRVLYRLAQPATA